MKFRTLSLLLVRPWFRFLWYLAWFLFMVLLNVILVVAWPDSAVTWSVAFWVRCFAIAISAWLIFGLGGTKLRWQGKDYLDRQRLDNEREAEVD